MTDEQGRRLGSADSERPVYGVDRSVGLTSEAKYASNDLSRYKLLEPGMFAYNPMRLNIGSIGYCNRERAPGLVSSDYVVFSCREDVLMPECLFYLTKSPAWQQWTSSAGVGSVRSRIYYRELATMPLSLPPLSEQRRIARILGALDDKIEFNFRMSHTLESIARAIFKSWFVDFGPVRKKMEGKTGGEVGLPPNLAALFPETMETTTTAAIPSGWRPGLCADSFMVTMGQAPPGNTYNEDGVGLPFYQGRRDFGERFPTRRVFCSAPARLARCGDTLVSVRAPVGDINISTEECCIGRGLAAVSHQSGGTMYTYEAMRALQPQFDDFEAGGTVFGAIGGKEFRNLPMVVPPPEIIQAYENAMHPIGAALELAHRNIHHLTVLRDSLLPALMNGELRGAYAFADHTLEVRT